MTSLNQILGDDTNLIKELKKAFLSSNVDENQCLNSDGLFLLCEKLKLSAFATVIIERVLCGAEVVDFYDFKERFISYLPEIIDASSGAVDPLLESAQHTARSLGYGDGQRMTRYETRLLCERTPNLLQLSVVDINNLFERADVERTGRISVQQFLAQYHLQKRLSAEVHFIADSFVSSVNLFEALDSAGSGNIDSHDLLEYWSKAGLRVDEGIVVLKEFGQPMSGSINAIYLSAFLERELSKTTCEAPVSVKAAIISLHCCIDNLRCTVRESECRAEHLHKQLQLGNQRRNLLIEELEDNQVSIEKSYEKRLRETEDRYRTRFLQMEDKFRLDKREIQNEVEELEEELSRLRQVETSTKNKVVLLERQNSRLLEENREQSEALSQMEQLNRQLRTELSKATQPRPVEESTQLILYKQKLEIVVAHNKRLRERIKDLSASQRKRSNSNDGEPSFKMKWSGAFRSQVMLIRRRRLAKGDTLSEMDSEPESIFVRHRKRRLLKRKERKMRHERVASRLHLQDSDEADSSRTLCSSATIVGSELNRICNEHKQELITLRQTAAKTLSEALSDQQKQLTLQLERERRQWELRLISEKNQLEKNFAEEKMKLMNRLQDDFDSELQRISSIVNRPENSSTAEHYKQQIKSLESLLESQKKNYEKRLMELRERFISSLQSHNNVFVPENRTVNFFSLLEKYRNTGPSPSGPLEPFASSRSSLSTEKHCQAGNQSLHRLSNMVVRCEKCDLTEMRLREIYHTVTGDQTLSESGIEDFSSSAGSLVDDKVVLKREVKKLKGRLETVKDKLTELRILLSVPPSRYKNSLCGNEGNGIDFRRTSFRFGEARGVIEKLISENVILEARLSEAQQLIKTLVEQYNTQLDETAKVGAVLCDVYLHPNPSSGVTQEISR